MKSIYSSVFIFLIACGSGTSTNDNELFEMADDTICLPNETQECVGPGGCKGGQVCSEDGTSFEPCDCGEDGGQYTTGGSGGETSSGGQAGNGGSTSIAGSGGTGGSGGENIGDAGATGGSDSGGTSSGGSDSGGSDAGGMAAGGTDSGPNCQPKSCATLTVELSGNTSGDYDSCGLLDDGCGGFVDCGGCAGKTPYADVYASCSNDTGLCENDCFSSTTPNICQNGETQITCENINGITGSPSPNCILTKSVFPLDVWCCN